MALNKYSNVNTSCSIQGRKKKNGPVDYTDLEAEENAAKVGALPRPLTTVKEVDDRGVFVRQPNYFITKFGDKEGELKAEPKRYIIYWTYSCNWSNRPVIATEILGLNDVIYNEPVLNTGETAKYGWGFGAYKDHKDPYTGAYFLSEFYRNADKNFDKRATTPTIVDLKTLKAVNNDYHRMSNYIEVYFYPYQTTNIDLYPKAYRDVIDEFNDWLFTTVNNGHYRMAFGQTPEAYKEGYDDFYDALEKLDKRFETNRFLFGDYITDSDIRFYVTLVRWETWYYKDIGPAKQRITEYKNIWGYVLDLFSLPEFKKYTFFPEKGRSSGVDIAQNNDFLQTYEERISYKIDYNKRWASDGSRAKLSNDTDVYLRHKKNESFSDYKSEIKDTIWNDLSLEERDPRNPKVKLNVDASINPLKGILSNK